MNSKLYMAPIRGVTNYVYRNAYHRLFGGYDAAVVPFIENCNINSSTNKVLRDLYPERNEVPYELIPQLLTKSFEPFIKACTILHTMGYATVNWNLGCPQKRIRNRMQGSGLLAHPDTVRAILDEALPKIPTALSIKVRLGGVETSELLALLPLLDGYPLKEIIIHPRTGVQMYAGDADVDAFEECRAKTNHKVIFNGDINSRETFEGLEKRFPDLDTWMIGRGGIINPFLIEEIRTKKRDPNAMRLERYKELHDTIFNDYATVLSGWRHRSMKMKEYWYYWSQAFENGRRFFHKLARAKSEERYTSLVDTFFSKQPDMVI